MGSVARRDSHYLPEPDIVLYGCRPLVPCHGYAGCAHDDPYPPFHVPETKPRKRQGPNFPSSACPTCKGSIGIRVCKQTGEVMRISADHPDHRTYCELCGSLSAKNESRATSERAGIDARERSHTTERASRNEIERKKRAVKAGGVKLSERERRRIWNGYKGGTLNPTTEPTNRAREGRLFLADIGQEPDWDLILDARGLFVGRYSDQSGDDAGTACGSGPS